MGYVVYVNKFHDRAVIHREECSYYQNRFKDRSKTGYWKGVFETREEAAEFARNTGKKLADCTFCMTRLSWKRRESKSISHVVKR